MTLGLKLDGITIRLGGQTIVQIDTQVDPGTVVTLMGPSGSGKSTLLNFIVGSLPGAFQASGQVWLDGRDITSAAPETRRIGILFQDDLLFPHLSVGGNLAFGLRAGGTIAERRAKIDTALAQVDLEGYATRDPATLSGGQKARVSLMRMLLSDPRALVLDEPFSRLDADLRKQVRDRVFTLARARNLPVLLVTHDAQDAEAAAGPILTLGSSFPR